MSRNWIRENPAVWDERKQEVIGGAPDGAFALDDYQLGKDLPGEWWRVEEDGRTVGYGWLDTTWGDAEILLAVAPSEQRRGVGSYILERLEQEAVAAGLNYMDNAVRATHPDGAGVTAWLLKRGFEPADEGRLRRRVGGAATAS